MFVCVCEYAFVRRCECCIRGRSAVVFTSKERDVMCVCVGAKFCVDKDGLAD